MTVINRGIVCFSSHADNPGQASIVHFNPGANSLRPNHLPLCHFASFLQNLSLATADLHLSSRRTLYVTNRRRGPSDGPLVYETQIAVGTFFPRISKHLEKAGQKCSLGRRASYNSTPKTSGQDAKGEQKRQGRSSVKSSASAHLFPTERLWLPSQSLCALVSVALVERQPAQSFPKLLT